MRNNTSLKNEDSNNQLEHDDAVRFIARHLLSGSHSPADEAESLRTKFLNWISVHSAASNDEEWRTKQIERFENVLSDATNKSVQCQPKTTSKIKSGNIADNVPANLTRKKGGVYFKLGGDERLCIGRGVEIIITAEPVHSDGRAEFAVGYATSGDGESGLCRYRLEEGKNLYSFRCAAGACADDGTAPSDYLGIWPDTNERGNSVLISNVVIKEISA